jgi:hypothetical protein
MIRKRKKEKQMATKKALRDLAEALLTSEDGIPEDAYDCLLKVMDPKDAQVLSRQTDATDGQFYVSNPIDWED